jgi:hypothetical protein
VDVIVCHIYVRTACNKRIKTPLCIYIKQTLNVRTACNKRIKNPLCIYIKQTFNNHTKHTALISEIREKLWERIQSEIDIIPNAEALKLHWMRCCWVYTFWSQAYANVLDLPPLTDYGFSFRVYK